MARSAISVEPDSSRSLIAETIKLPRISLVLPYVRTDENDIHHLSLAVEGVHCAGCIQKIESSLRKIPQVRSARLNFSTRRLAVSWQGEKGLADKVAATITALGYKNSAFDQENVSRSSEKEAKFLLLCLGIAGFAAGNIMLVSFALWTTDIQTMGVATRDFLHWISALIAVPAIAFSGRPFFLSAFTALKSGRTNMDVPISVGLILTTSMSLFELVTHGEHAYFDSAVMLMFFLLIGRYLDYLGRANARQAASDLLSLMNGTATILEDGSFRSIMIKNIEKDMLLQIAMGEHIPADGIIVEGNTDIDTSLVTGESLPRAALKGSEILSGTLNLSAPILIRTLGTAEESQLGGMVRLMEQAEQSQAAYVRIADRVARLYTPVVHLLALAAFFGWLILGHMIWQNALLIAATVLIITCPCALALAVPIVQVLAVSLLMKRGIMVRSGDVLERLATIDTVIFDKTGTLTLGQPQLINGDEIEPEIFALAAAMAAHSHHPLAKALTKACHGEYQALTVNEIPGSGLIAVHDGQELRLGRRAWATSLPLPEHDNKMEIVFSVNGRQPVSFLFKDELRSDAREVIRALELRGMHIHLLSGDRLNIVKSVAETLGLKDFHAEMTPEQKFIYMNDLKRSGHKIMMVGDGINDAPILAGADVSVSPASGIDIAKNASSVIFTGDLLNPLLQLLTIGTAAQRLVRQNFGMTIIYNMIAIPAAFMGYITPLIAAAAMSLSSLAVISNAFRIRRIK